MTTNSFEILAINRTQVLYGKDATVFVTPHREDGYAFRIAARVCKIEQPECLHGEKGDITKFPGRLSAEDVRLIGNFSKAGEIVDKHFSDTPEDFADKLALARFVTGIAIEQGGD